MEISNKPKVKFKVLKDPPPLKSIKMRNNQDEESENAILKEETPKDENPVIDKNKNREENIMKTLPKDDLNPYKQKNRAILKINEYDVIINTIKPRSSIMLRSQAQIACRKNGTQGSFTSKVKDWSNLKTFKKEATMMNDKMAHLENIITYRHVDKDMEKEREALLRKLCLKYPEKIDKLIFASGIIGRVWKDMGGFGEKYIMENSLVSFFACAGYYILWDKLNEEGQQDNIPFLILQDLKLELFHKRFLWLFGKCDNFKFFGSVNLFNRYLIKKNIIEDNILEEMIYVMERDDLKIKEEKVRNKETWLQQSTIESNMRLFKEMECHVQNIELISTLRKEPIKKKEKERYRIKRKRGRMRKIRWK